MIQLTSISYLLPLSAYVTYSIYCSDSSCIFCLHTGEREAEREGALSRIEGATAPSLSIPDDDGDSDLSDSLDYLDGADEFLDIINIRLNPCQKPKIKSLFQSNSVGCHYN